MTGLHEFDRMVQKSLEWIKDVDSYLGWDDKQKAYLTVKVVFATLRDRLTVEETAQLTAQFPMLLKGVFYEGWQPARLPIKMNRDAFLDRIRESFLKATKGPNPQNESGLAEADVDPEVLARGVFAMLNRRVSEGEINDILAILPSDIQNLWPAQPTTARMKRL